jgi:tRNA-2-methylthio-N6-dimethylallyladenosine synthase
MKYSIITFGCQMNISDSQRIASLFEKEKYRKTKDITKADLVIINMCSVRQSAVTRVYGLVPKLREIKGKSILTGCFLKKDQKKLEELFDFVIKPSQFPEFLKSKSEFLNIEPAYSSFPIGYIPIMTGCNNFCTYCVVPYTRGREYSRSVEEIVKEAKNLIKKGYKEIWLLGQNVNSYFDKKERNFPSLLKTVNNLKGDFWLKFTSSHPKDFTKELIEAMKNSKKVSKYLNLPLQSGNDKILKKMNRPYTFSQYEKTVQMIKKEIKDISLSTDIIVGFPSETKKQFQDTADALKKKKFEMSYISIYSERQGTKAAEIKDKYSLKEKKII